MEKLYEIWSEDRYDLLVLDTPPSRNALDFLEAPNRLLQFIEGRSLQVFLAPTGFAAKVAGRGTSMMFSILRRITGVDLLQDLSEFFGSFSGMVGGFRERATKVNELLVGRAQLLPRRLRPAVRDDRRGLVLPRQAGRAEPAVRRRDREQGPSRRRRASGRRGSRAPRRPRERPGRPRGRQLRATTDYSPSATGRTSNASRGAGDERDHRGALPGRGRPRPRRAHGGEPLPVRRSVRLERWSRRPSQAGRTWAVTGANSGHRARHRPRARTGGRNGHPGVPRPGARPARPGRRAEAASGAGPAARTDSTSPTSAPFATSRASSPSRSSPSTASSTTPASWRLRARRPRTASSFSSAPTTSATSP